MSKTEAVEKVIEAVKREFDRLRTSTYYQPSISIYLSNDLVREIGTMDDDDRVIVVGLK